MPSAPFPRLRRGAVRLGAILTVALASALPASAQDAPSGWYYGANLGINLTNHLTLAGIPGSISTSAGPRGDVFVGYLLPAVADFSVAIEADGGVLYNSLNTASIDGYSASVSGSYTQVPLLGNLVLNYNTSACTFYAGAGGGMDYSTLRGGGVGVAASGSEGDSAYDFMLGLRRSFGSGFSFGLAYEYLATRPSGLNTVGSQGFVASLLFRF